MRGEIMDVTNAQLAEDRDHHEAAIWWYDHRRQWRICKAVYRHFSTAASRLIRMRWNGAKLERYYVTICRMSVERPYPFDDTLQDMTATDFLALVDAWLTPEHASTRTKSYLALKARMNHEEQSQS